MLWPWCTLVYETLVVIVSYTRPLFWHDHDLANAGPREVLDPTFVFDCDFWMPQVNFIVISLYMHWCWNSLMFILFFLSCHWKEKDNRYLPFLCHYNNICDTSLNVRDYFHCDMCDCNCTASACGAELSYCFVSENRITLWHLPYSVIAADICHVSHIFSAMFPFLIGFGHVTDVKQLKHLCCSIMVYHWGQKAHTVPLYWHFSQLLENICMRSIDSEMLVCYIYHMHGCDLWVLNLSLWIALEHGGQFSLSFFPL
jgi:hypothetical protein